MKITVFVEWTKNANEWNIDVKGKKHDERRREKKVKSKHRFRFELQTTQTVRYVSCSHIWQTNPRRERERLGFGCMRNMKIEIDIRRVSWTTRFGSRSSSRRADIVRDACQLHAHAANNKESYLASRFGQQHNQIMTICTSFSLLFLSIPNADCDFDRSKQAHASFFHTSPHSLSLWIWA